MTLVGPDTSSFEDLDLQIFYMGTGEQILTSFVLPALQVAVAYDRVTSFFSVGSLLAISQGVESLWRRGGRMRLILGIHDVPADLARAASVEDEVEELVGRVRRELLDGVATLADELARNRIAALAWMIQDGLLDVRVAAPTPVGARGTEGGVFHNKRYVFRDTHGCVITADGSPNETVLGLGANFEELTVHMSWRDHSDEYTRVHVGSFEKLWDNNQPGVQVVPLDPSFAEELLSALAFPPRKTEVPTSVEESIVGRVLDAALRIPTMSVLNLGTAALYPHQERAFVDAASRWPIRAILADEVGLGKTLEAAAVIAYAIQHCEIERVTILAPAGLVHQWQDELRQHFGLEFNRYESGSRCYVAPDGTVQGVPSGLGPIGAHAPARVVMSAQLARGDRRHGHVFEKASVLPELLVVDEAHAARITRVPGDSNRPTLIRRMLEAILPEIPHVLFLTATPMQLDVLEYRDLLSLLGLPEAWDESAYLRSLQGLASAKDAPSLQVIKTSIEGAGASLRTFRPNLDRLFTNQEQREDAERLRATSSVSASEATHAQSRWTELHPVIVAAHPGHLLTIRHTRAALEKLGYHFPARSFSAPELDIAEPVRAFYRAVDDYLENAFGAVEAAIHPDKAKSLGFMKSTYRQRLASSLLAAEITLSRRRDRIKAIGSGLDVVSDPVAEGEDDEDITEWAAESSARVIDAPLEYACRTEIFHLDHLLDRLASLEIDAIGSDPKLDALMTLIGRHLAQGDKILAFSRYTDTVDAAIAEFRNRHLGFPPPPFGRYTGGQSWIDLGSGEQPLSKEALRAALESGAVTVVFCSEAASEGLNLQAARVLINIDVPWNPARLEQRIGRIARLGQRAENVEIYNLWYPDSVESRIYTRLLQRKELYDLAVGEYPEIVSRAIRAELASGYAHGIDAVTDDPIELLQGLRTNQQLAAIRRLWGGDSESPGGSQAIRDALATLIQATVRTLGGSVSDDADGHRIVRLGNLSWRFTRMPGELDSLTLRHPVLDLLRQTRQRALASTPLELVNFAAAPVAFALRTATTRHILAPSDFPSLLSSLVTGTPFKANTPAARPDVENADLEETIRRISPWWPDPRGLTPMFDGPIEVKVDAHVTFETLGLVEVVE